MRKIGITGSISSGKTTASKILSKGRGPLFSADLIVKRLYQKKNFLNLLSKKFGLKERSNIKKIVKRGILNKSLNINKLEKIIHPLVRKEMKKFISKNKKKQTLFFEIPLLIESKLMKNFDFIIFIKSKKNLRLRRFKLKGGSARLFKILSKKQLTDDKKIKHCDLVIVNNKNIKYLKQKLSSIL